MDSELEETLKELFSYFQLAEVEWPMACVYTQGEYISGVIDDDLYNILTRLVELHEELRDASV